MTILTIYLLTVSISTLSLVLYIYNVKGIQKNLRKPSIITALIPILNIYGSYLMLKAVYKKYRLIIKIQRAINELKEEYGDIGKAQIKELEIELQELKNV